MNTLQAGWESYKLQVLPKDAGKNQTIETRRAFYAGAASMRMVALSAADMSEEAAIAVLDSVEQEITDFVAEIQQGRA